MSPAPSHNGPQTGIHTCLGLAPGEEAKVHGFELSKGALRQPLQGQQDERVTLLQHRRCFCGVCIAADPLHRSLA